MYSRYVYTERILHQAWTVAMILHYYLLSWKNARLHPGVHLALLNPGCTHTERQVSLSLSLSLQAEGARPLPVCSNLMLLCYCRSYTS